MRKGTLALTREGKGLLLERRLGTSREDLHSLVVLRNHTAAAGDKVLHLLDFDFPFALEQFRAARVFPYANEQSLPVRS